MLLFRIDCNGGDGDNSPVAVTAWRTAEYKRELGAGLSPINVLVDLMTLNSEVAGDWATGVWDAKAFGGAMIELRLVRSPAKE